MIVIDYKDHRSLYQQIVEKIEELIAQGLLKADEQLPSVRQLAVELAINPNTIQKAYSELEKRGVTYSVKGIGNFVSSDLENVLEKRKQTVLQKLGDITHEVVLLRIDKKEFLNECSKFYEKWKEE